MNALKKSWKSENIEETFTQICYTVNKNDALRHCCSNTSWERKGLNTHQDYKCNHYKPGKILRKTVKIFYILQKSIQKSFWGTKILQSPSLHSLLYQLAKNWKKSLSATD